jgi:hypothetical protein
MGLLLMIGWIGCGRDPSRKIQSFEPIDTVARSPVADRVVDRRCGPPDSLLSNGVSVSYPQDDATYDIAISNSHGTLLMGYKFDCIFAQAYVPRVYFVANDFIVLRRGCGSWCAMSIFYNISGYPKELFEQRNVVAIDTVTRHVAYLDGDGVGVLNLEGEEVMRKAVDYRCWDLIECVDSVDFVKGAVRIFFEDGSSAKYSYPK